MGGGMGGGMGGMGGGGFFGGGGGGGGGFFGGGGRPGGGGGGFGGGGGRPPTPKADLFSTVDFLSIRSRLRSCFLINLVFEDVVCLTGWMLVLRRMRSGCV